MEREYSLAYSQVNRISFVPSNSHLYRTAAVTLAKRLDARMKKRGYTQASLARAVKVSQPTIFAILNGDTKRPKDLRKIALELETSEAWLLGETDDPEEGALGVTDRDTLAEKLGLSLIPELELGYSMGGGNYLEVYEHKGFRAFDREWLRSISRGELGALFVARGEGDSMEPTLKDGDIVLIDTSQKDIRQQDRIWALSYGELGMIKRVRRLPGGSYELMSDNATVKPVTANDGEMHVVGRVIWIGRRI